MHWSVFPVFTIVADFAAVCLLVTSFVSNYWVIYDVDRKTLGVIAVNDPTLKENLDNQTFYRDRHKGLFSVCYTGDFEGCDTRTGYELKLGGLESGTPSDVWSDDYSTRIQLMRTHLFSMGIAILLMLLTLTLVLLATCRKSISTFRFACAFSTVTCLLIALAMAVFHGIEYFEKKVLKEDPFPAGWSSIPEHYELSLNTSIRFGYSLFLGWAALVVAIAGTIMVMWTGVTIPVQTSTDSTRSLTTLGGGDESYYSSSLARNRAYDIVDGKDIGDADIDDNAMMHGDKSGDFIIRRDMENFAKH